MRTVKVGQTVRLPKGNKATVRSIAKVHTGKRGRPAHLAIVQQRNDHGHFIAGVKPYRPSDLQPA